VGLGVGIGVGIVGIVGDIAHGGSVAVVYLRVGSQRAGRKEFARFGRLSRGDSVCMSIARE
jgi:hypothetical protein